jgi:hypothetical protein
MKVQVLDLVEDLTQLEGGMFHFLKRLTQTMNFSNGYVFHFLTILTYIVNYAHIS